MKHFVSHEGGGTSLKRREHGQVWGVLIAVCLQSSQTSNRDNGWTFQTVMVTGENVWGFTLVEREMTCWLRAGEGW